MFAFLQSSISEATLVWLTVNTRFFLEVSGYQKVSKTFLKLTYHILCSGFYAAMAFMMHNIII